MSKNRKTFVFDTSVLLHDADSIFKFKNSDLVIPLTVLEELDRVKSDRTDLGRNARQISRQLDELRKDHKLSEGAKLAESGSTIRVARLDGQLPKIAGFPTDVADNAIILTAKHFQDQGQEVVFVSKDINARIKADLIGVRSEDFRRGISRGDEFFTGWSELEIDPSSAKTINGARVGELFREQNPEKKIYPNQYFITWVDKERDRYRLFKNCPAEDKITEVRKTKELWSFQGKNPKQRMALDLLTDDTVQLVCLIGPAGTGKTFLTLLAGMHKVIVQKAYSRLFVARPLVSLGADIGFIPGDLQEKLFHWMHPIYDNLEFIFNEMREREEFCELFESGPRRGPGRHRRGGGGGGRHRSNFAEEPLYTYNPTIHDSVARLQSRGLLGLEAITYMRGRSIPNQYMFIDEAQNLTAQEIKTIISRAGDGTKVILSGDPHQIDSPLLDFFSSGLTITSEKLKNESIVGTVMLEDSERSPLAKMAIARL